MHRGRGGGARKRRTKRGSIDESVSLEGDGMEGGTTVGFQQVAATRDANLLLQIKKLKTQRVQNRIEQHLFYFVAQVMLISSCCKQPQKKYLTCIKHVSIHCITVFYKIKATLLKL